MGIRSRRLALFSVACAALLPAIVSADAAGEAGTGNGTFNTSATQSLTMKPSDLKALGPPTIVPKGVLNPQKPPVGAACPPGKQVTGFSDIGSGPSNFPITAPTPYGYIIEQPSFTFSGDSYTIHWKDPDGVEQSASGGSAQSWTFTPNGSTGPPVTYQQYLATHKEVVAVPIMQQGKYDEKGLCVGAVYGNLTQSCCEIVTGLYVPPGPCSIATNCVATAFFPGTPLDLVLKTTDNIGRIEAKPDGPGATFVGIPTCAALATGLPESGNRDVYATPKTITVGDARGTYTYTVGMRARITPGSVSWSFGEPPGNDGPDAGVGNHPANNPGYDAVNQSWPDSENPCQIWHKYRSVSDGRTITAWQSFTVAYTALWNDSRGGYGSLAAPCQGGPSCTVVVGPPGLNTPQGNAQGAPGWSLTKPVYQIQGIPYFA